MYLSELCGLVLAGLRSPQWGAKRCAACALVAICDTLNPVPRTPGNDLVGTVSRRVRPPISRMVSAMAGATSASAAGGASSEAAGEAAGGGGSAAARTAPLTGATALQDCAVELVSVLEGQLVGRIWQGKESVLEALASLVSLCPQGLLSAQTGTAGAGAAGGTSAAPFFVSLVESMIKDSNRSQQEYYITAMPWLGQVVQEVSHHGGAAVETQAFPMLSRDYLLPRLKELLPKAAQAVVEEPAAGEEGTAAAAAAGGVGGVAAADGGVLPPGAAKKPKRVDEKEVAEEMKANKRKLAATIACITDAFPFQVLFVSLSLSPPLSPSSSSSLFALN